MSTQIEVTQRRSGIGRSGNQRVVLRGLGLRGIGRRVVLRDTPPVRGMIRKVQHLVDVRVFEGEAPLSGRRHRG